MDYVISNIVDITFVVISAALIALVTMIVLRRAFKFDLSVFYERTAIIISFSLLIASAGFNYSFTHGFLVEIIPMIAVIGALVMGAVNIGAFFIDVSLAKSIKQGKYLIASAFVFSRLAILIYSVISASTVFHSSQLHIDKLNQTNELKIQQLKTSTEMAKESLNNSIVSIIPDEPLYNLRGDVVSINNCKAGGHSFYLSQSVCKDFLLNKAANSQNYLATKASNLEKAIEVSSNQRMKIEPILNISPVFIFILIAFLLDAVAFAMVMFVEFFNDSRLNNHSPTLLSVQKEAKPDVVQQKTDGLTNAAECAAMTLSSGNDVTDSDIASLIMELHKYNYDERISVNELNKIIKSEIGYGKNKANLIDIMNDSPFITSKLVSGKKEYYFSGENVSVKKATTNDRQREDDAGNRGSTSLRKRLSSDF